MDICNLILSILNTFFVLIGLVFVIFGWIIPFRQEVLLEKQKSEENRKIQKIIWEKDLIDQQISKLYGPISALLQEQEIKKQVVLTTFERKSVFDDKHVELKDLTDEERKKWIHFVDTYKIPINNKIIEIIRENKHLLFNFEIPICFEKFLEYALGWELLDNQKRNNVPNFYQYHYTYSFPYEFSDYIDKTLKLLLSKKQELIGIMNQLGTAF